MESSKISTCIELLNSAKSDNEKLAALMLVPKLLNTGISASSSQSKEEESHNSDSTISIPVKESLYKAIGFQFLRRILVSGLSSVESEQSSLTDEQLTLKAVGLSVLRCFTDCEVLTEDEVRELISVIESILLLDAQVTERLASVDLTETGNQPDQWQGSHDQVIQLATELLEELAKNMSSDTLDVYLMPSLYKIAMKQSKPEPLLSYVTRLISNIIKHKGRDWLSTNSTIAACAVNLHQLKVSGVADVDFNLCAESYLLLIDIDMKSLPTRLHALADSVMCLLSDVLRNKLPSLKRQQALRLLTGLIQCRGIRTLIKEKGSKAALLVIHLCSVECRMTLENDNLDEVSKAADTLCSSFFALEQMIFYMAHEETTLQLGAKEIIQVHSALQGAISAVIYFLTNYCNTEECDSTLSAVTSACIRLLGAWTAEETESLLDKYTKALPDLLIICKRLLTDIDCVKFLIPGLSNLTTDTVEIVGVVISHFTFISDYIGHCCERLSAGKEEYEHVLVNTCVVVLNCVMMPDVTHNADEMHQMLARISHLSPQTIGSCKNVDCCLTLLVCGLSLARKLLELGQDEAASVTDAGDGVIEKFYRLSVDYMLNVTAYQSQDGACSSAEVPEIWLMGIQVLGDLMKTDKELTRIVIEPDSIKAALALFEKYSSIVDIAFVLERLLILMAEKAGTGDLIQRIKKSKKK